MNAFTKEVVAFARALGPEDLAKMLGFFHLADQSKPPVIDLEVDSSGSIALRISSPPSQRD